VGARGCPLGLFLRAAQVETVPNKSNFGDRPRDAGERSKRTKSPKTLETVGDIGPMVTASRSKLVPKTP
jgi:hypothetical protein